MRGESKGDLVHKISIVAKEASKNEYWLLLLKELYPDVAEIEPARVEAGELVRNFDKIRYFSRARNALLARTST